jgi:hypothetical protein
VIQCAACGDVLDEEADPAADQRDDTGRVRAVSFYLCEPCDQWFIPRCSVCGEGMGWQGRWISDSAEDIEAMARAGTLLCDRCDKAEATNEEDG